MTQELKHKIHKEATKYVDDERRVTRSEYTAYLAGAEAMYTELAPLVEWVSVKDRLPEEYKEVLIKCEMWGEIIIVSGHISSMGIFFTRFGSGNNEGLVNVTHWRRIEL